MAAFRKIFSGGGVAVVTVLLFAAVAVCTAEQVQVESDAYVRLAIVNSFLRPTQFNCYSNTQNRGTYIAAPNEFYYFAFNPLQHQFWDCVVVSAGSSQPAMTGTFRFWADATHGTPQIDSDSCGTYCNWQVDIFGVEQFVAGKWSLKYHWGTPSV